ncbi:MAG: class I SAM-dependent methyltransferase [Proteobacteria bacterium]|nr:class I SAM-dependent methyltransferase [Pseudomonadota bacterium]
MKTVLCDARADAVLDRLDQEARTQSSEMRRYYDAKKQQAKRTTDPDSPDDMAFVRDKFVALDPEKCDLCYMLCRSIKARRVVEFGTSFGVSTIYLAAAVRDTVRENSGNGIVIGTEIEPTKATVANANLAEAGLGTFVEIRVGDARQTLKDVGGPVDFLLLDSWIPLVRPVMDVVAPQLRPGAIVVCDNVQMYEHEYADYTAFVRNPKNGFRSVLLSHEGGLEISVKLD